MSFWRSRSCWRRASRRPAGHCRDVPFRWRQLVDSGYARRGWAPVATVDGTDARRVERHHPGLWLGANPAGLTGFLMREEFPRIVESIINQPAVGTLVVASAGSEARAQEAISLRQRSTRGLVYMWTGARADATALPVLKAAAVPIFYSPAGLARGLNSLLAYHVWRDQRRRVGFASAPPRARTSGGRARLGDAARSARPVGIREQALAVRLGRARHAGASRRRRLKRLWPPPRR